MARRAVAGAVVGAVFGVTLCASGLASPVVIRDGLLFHSSYLFLFFGSAVAVAFVGLRLVRGRRAVLTGESVSWRVKPPRRGQLIGSVLFGVGWAIADACPGPVATQVGQGRLWSLFTLAGIGVGIVVFGRLETRGSEPQRARAALAARAGA